MNRYDVLQGPGLCGLSLHSPMMSLSPSAQHCSPQVLIPVNRRTVMGVANLEVTYIAPVHICFVLNMLESYYECCDIQKHNL